MFLSSVFFGFFRVFLVFRDFYDLFEKNGGILRKIKKKWTGHFFL